MQEIAEIYMCLIQLHLLEKMLPGRRLDKLLDCY